MKTKRMASLLCAVFMIMALTAPANAAGCPECGDGTLVTTVYMEPSCEEDGMNIISCTSCGYSYEDMTSPLGHNYKTTSTATCTSAGVVTHTCTRCGDSYKEKQTALGHSFTEVKEEPTCTEDGEIALLCWRCGLRYVQEVLPATGHDYELAEKEPTCTEDGVRTGHCKACGEEIFEKLPAFGHKYEAEETAPTCTEDGERIEKCAYCGDTIKEILPATGHDFSEWTVVEKPTLFKEGREERSCSEGDASEDHVLPKKTLKESPGAIAAIAAAVSGIGLAVALIAKKAAVAGAAAAEASSLGYITLQMKKLVLYTKETETNRTFLEQLKKRPYLDIKTVPYGDTAALLELAEKEHPNLFVLSAESAPGLEALTAEVKAAYKDADFSVIDETGLNGAALAAMKESKRIMGYASATENGEKKIAKLILPLYKPDRSTGNWAENATLITDAIGLPIVSILLNTYVVGGDVVDAVKNRGMGTADAADLVNDVAGLFGLDVLANIAEVLRVGADQKDRLDDKKELDKK